MVIDKFVTIYFNLCHVVLNMQCCSSPMWISLFYLLLRFVDVLENDFNVLIFVNVRLDLLIPIQSIVGTQTSYPS